MYVFSYKKIIIICTLVVVLSRTFSTVLANKEEDLELLLIFLLCLIFEEKTGNDDIFTVAVYPIYGRLAYFLLKSELYYH